MLETQVYHRETTQHFISEMSLNTKDAKTFPTVNLQIDTVPSYN